MTLKKRFLGGNPRLVRFSFSFSFSFSVVFVLPDPQFILFSSSMGSVYCVAWFVFACASDKFLGGCVLEIYGVYRLRRW